MSKRQKPGDHHIQAVWTDVLDLSNREQLQIYEWLRQHLAARAQEAASQEPR